MRKERSGWIQMEALVHQMRQGRNSRMQKRNDHCYFLKHNDNENNCFFCSQYNYIFIYFMI